MNKCPKTISGIHIWMKDFNHYTGKEKETMVEKTYPFGEKTTELVKHHEIIVLPKCSACGIVDDTKIRQN